MSRIALRLLTLLLLISGLFLVAACGTSDDGSGTGTGDDTDGPTGGESRIGYVTVTERHPEGEEPSVSAGAAFMSYDADLPDGYTESPYETDTCTVFTLADGIDFPVPDADADVAPLSAGEPLTLEAGGATYAELTRIGTGGGGSTDLYGADGSALESPVPDDLAVTIPGDEFPAFADAAFPDAEPLNLTAPTDANVSADTTFRWDAPSGEATTFVAFNAYADDGTYVGCTVEDDGAFALPDETVAELGADFSGRLESAERLALRTETSGDAVLFLFSGWQQEFAPDLPGS